MSKQVEAEEYEAGSLFINGWYSNPKNAWVCVARTGDDLKWEQFIWNFSTVNPTIKKSK